MDTSFSRIAKSEPTPAARAWWPAIKRGIDAGVAGLALVALLPVLAAIALAIKLESRGPVFYRARRTGYRGRAFGMLKFRKMRNDARGGPLTMFKDARLTRVGALLVKTRLDELPQLWDVLRGRMSLIGPRPEDPRFVALHPDAYQRILLVRPGLTGLAQLAYAEERHILNDKRPIQDYIERLMPQKLGLDSLYANESSLRLDLRIVRWTLVALLFSRPIAVHRGTGRMNIRRRPSRVQAPDAEAREQSITRAGARAASEDKFAA